MFDGIDESKMCPIGLGSHLLGDKWIPIIIRDIALLNRRTFSEILKKNAEGISSGSLASRLQRMVELNMLNVES
ncbi:transcriptional regulator, partial [Alphaproteobacteria bacterium]|nr:transcriptional regulator [Alphaproteobacteria bacterium]